VRVVHVAESIKGGIATYLSSNSRIENVNFYYFIPESQRSELVVESDNIIPFYGADRISRMISLIKIFYKNRNILKERNTILHLHSTGAGIVYLIVKYFIGVRCSVIYSSHGWSGLRELGSVSKVVSIFLDKIISISPDRIVDISYNENKYSLGVLKINPNKVHMIYNGVDFGCQITNKTVSGGDVVKFIFVGRFDRQKGFDLLINAFINVERADVKLSLVGDYVLGAQDESEGGIYDDRIIRHGWVSRSKLFDILSGGDYLVMPSRWEGFGLTAIESMSLGVPVICSDRGALPEIVGDAGIIVSLDETQDLTDLIDSLEIPTEIARNAAKERAAFFSVQRMNTLMKEVYSDLFEKN
jgi:glycosyltransferase involved in cell wall biosynthesis